MVITNKLIFKLWKTLKRRGLIGLFKGVGSRSKTFVNQFRPSVRAVTHAREKRCAMFDQKLGVETSGFIHHTDLRTNNPNQLFASSYFGSDPEYVRAAIVALPIDYKNFVFIDYGSGKGRVILLATEFPFNGIVGVEFSHELHSIAKENIRRYPRDAAHCKKVESICMDAANYPLPAECLVLYFFNPFDKKIMSLVLQNIQKSLLENPREIFIVYANPVEADLFDQAACFKRFLTTGPVSIWRTTPEAQGRKDCEFDVARCVVNK